MVNLYILIRALYTGLFTGIIIAIPMGPAGIESVRWTISKGLSNGVKVAAGSLIADAIDVMLINFGLFELIQTNKLIEVFFWLFSGAVILYIGKNALKESRNGTKPTQEIINKKVYTSKPVFTGFIINISNPMTHTFWLTLSSTVIRVWRNAGRLPYFIFAVSMLCGMFLSLWGINFLASKGNKIAIPKASGKISSILAYGIIAVGIGFILFGLYILFIFIAKVV